jgi:hypothetical protein
MCPAGILDRAGERLADEFDAADDPAMARPLAPDSRPSIDPSAKTLGNDLAGQILVASPPLRGTLVRVRVCAGKGREKQG